MSWDAPPPPGDPQQQPTQPYQPTLPYGQPAPLEQPTPPYGQPYGPPPGQYGGPYYPTYPAPPQPKRRLTGFYIALGVVAVVVAAGVAVGVAATSSGSGNGGPAALGTNSSAASTTASPAATDTASATDTATTTASQSPHVVALPTSAGPLNLLINADTARRTANVRSSLTGNVAYQNPKIGFYTVGSDSSYSVWMLAEDTTDIPIFKTSVGALGDLGMARQIARGANMTNVTVESPGPLGGALLCGKLAIEGNSFRVCEWVDDSTYGWVYFMPSVRESNVLAYTLDLRDAAEQ